jgi:sugar phosphate isomerase/epimerase
MTTKIGLIGLVNEEAQQDFWGTMQRVAAVGYRGVESPSALLKGDVQENVRRFHDLGLQVVAMGASREDLSTRLDEIIANAAALQTQNIIVYWGPCESRQQLLADAALYNEAGARIREAGLRLCYHNHDHEFRATYDGLYALDLLAEHTDPQNVYFEIDIAWTTFGGEDPVRVLRRYAGRVPIIHVKDFWSLEDRSHFTAVGTGVVRIKDALQAAVDVGVEWAVVEQDQLRSLTAFETITVSYLNIKEQFPQLV